MFVLGLELRLRVWAASAQRVLEMRAWRPYRAKPIYDPLVLQQFADRVELTA